MIVLMISCVLIVDGGHSSFEYNQNAYSIKKPQEQGVALGVALSQRVLADAVHGVYRAVVCRNHSSFCPERFTGAISLYAGRCIRLRARAMS